MSMASAVVSSSLATEPAMLAIEIVLKASLHLVAGVLLPSVLDTTLAMLTTEILLKL